MLDTDATRSYANRANLLLSMQAINHCPDRRLELESMAPHLASMLTETVDELSRMYRALHGRNGAQKTYTAVDRTVLDVVSRFNRSMLRDLLRIIEPSATCRQIEDSLQHLQDQGDVTYQRRGKRMGWSTT